MNEAQLGLVLVTPAVIAVAVALYRQGALSLGGAIVASLAASTVAAFLFMAQ